MQHRNKTIVYQFRWWFSLVILVVQFLVPSSPLHADTELSDQYLKKHIKDTSKHFIYAVSAAAERIALQTDDLQIKRAAIRWKIASLVLCRETRNNTDTKSAFIDLWTLSYQMLNYFEEGIGKNRFGDQQNIAISASKAIVEEIDGKAKLIFPDDQFEEVKKKISAYALSHPIESFTIPKIDRPSTSARKGDPVILSILSLPLKPLMLGESIDKTSDSVDRAVNIANRFTENVEELPTELRWQTELILNTIDENRLFNDALKISAEYLTVSHNFLRLAEDYPKLIFELLVKILQEIEAKQPSITQTLNEIQNTLRLLNSLVHPSDQVLLNLKDAGVAWRETLQELNKLNNRISREKPFDIQEYESAAREIKSAADEMRKLISELHMLLTSDEIKDKMSNISKITESTIDYLFYRLLLLIIILLLGLLAYRILAHRLTRN